MAADDGLTLGGPAVRLAEVAYRSASSDPHRATRLAREVLGRPDASAEARVIAGHAIAQGLLQLGQLSTARRHLAEALDLAEASGLTPYVGELLTTSALLWFHAEQPRRATTDLENAMSSGVASEARARVLGQVAYFLFRAGRYEHGLEQAEQALAILAADGAEQGGAEGAAGGAADGRWEDDAADAAARILSNRAVAHSYAGRHDEAIADLHRALALHRSRGSDVLAAQVLHNLGFVAAQSGDTPTALRRFDEALAEHVRLRLPTHHLLVDRSDALYAARLLPEARRSAEEAVRALEAAGLGADAAEARVTAAEIALAEGDVTAAVEHSSVALGAFAQQRRPAWATRARSIGLQAKWRASTDVAAVAEEALVTADELAAAGWRLTALDVLITAACAALDAGRHDLLAEFGFASVIRESPEIELPVLELVRVLHLRALATLGRGERAAALRTLRRGLELADAHVAVLGATELRLSGGAVASRLATTGLGIVLDRRRPRSVLAWAEAGRAASLRAAERRGSTDPELAQMLSQLRESAAARVHAVAEGHPTDAFDRRRLDLERAIRLRALSAVPGDDSSLVAGGGRTPKGHSASELRERLGRGVLVELVAHRGQLYGLVVGAGTTTLHDLGPAVAVRRAVALQRFALGRLVLGRGGSASLLASAGVLRRSVGDLESRLLGPLAARLEAAAPDAAVTVVPAGPLYGAAWSLFRGLSGRPVAVTPSAAWWLGRDESVPPPPDRGRPLLASGPDVVSGPAEVRALLAGRYPGATVLEGAAATCSSVLAALDGAPVAHVAAHGRFRADNPLLSSLALVDGDLTVHELGGLGTAPRCLVLSACDSGRLAVHAGDDPVGVVAALLGIGAGAVIASVAPLPDPPMPEVSLDVHESLAAGGAPASALLAARQAAGHPLDLGDDELASGSTAALRSLAAALLVCFGDRSSVP